MVADATQITTIVTRALNLDIRGCSGRTIAKYLPTHTTPLEISPLLARHTKAIFSYPNRMKVITNFYTIEKCETRISPANRRKFNPCVSLKEIFYFKHLCVSSGWNSSQSGYINIQQSKHLLAFVLLQRGSKLIPTSRIPFVLFREKEYRINNSTKSVEPKWNCRGTNEHLHKLILPLANISKS